jgi:hypothetical protein
VRIARWQQQQVPNHIAASWEIARAKEIVIEQTTKQIFASAPLKIDRNSSTDKASRAVSRDNA